MLLFIFLIFLFISLEDFRCLKISHRRLFLLAVCIVIYIIFENNLSFDRSMLAELLLPLLPSLLSEFINGFFFSFRGIGGSDIWLLCLCSLLLGPDYMWEAYLVDLLLFLAGSFLCGKKRMAMGPAICLGTTSMLIFCQLF